VRVLDGRRDRDHVVEHAEHTLGHVGAEQIVLLATRARPLEPLLEGHLEPLQDHELGIDLVADRGRYERVVALARGEQLHHVRVPLHPLEELLLHLETHVIFVTYALLEDLDDDLAAEVGLRLEPALFAEVGLGEAARAELDRHASRVEHERIRARADHVEGAL
jgi:hypothetical protein